MSSARALLFPGEEDFGIVPVEAQAGLPVIAYEVGGASETVIDGGTGVLFEQQSALGLTGAIERFEGLELAEQAIRQNAERFGRERFRLEMAEAIERLPQYSRCTTNAKTWCGDRDLQGETVAVAAQARHCPTAQMKRLHEIPIDMDERSAGKHHEHCMAYAMLVVGEHDDLGPQSDRARAGRGAGAAQPHMYIAVGACLQVGAQ